MNNIEVTVLGSGSKGNCTLVETSNTKLLIDCGFSARETVRRLELAGVAPNEINGILLTHEHKDHTAGVENFVKKFNVPVFGNEISLAEYERTLSSSNVQLNDFKTSDFYFRELTIAPFDVSHDSKHCNGYSIYCEGDKFSLATDLGYVDENILDSLRGSSIIVLESNHEPDYLMSNPNYPSVLKERIAGRRGHLSNQDCAKAILDLAQFGTTNFMLAHLSQENNTPEKAMQITCNTLKANGADVGSEIKIDIASQTLITKPTLI